MGRVFFVQNTSVIGGFPQYLVEAVAAANLVE
jgi:hypothetical protein